MEIGNISLIVRALLQSMLIKLNKHDAIRAINDRFAATADHRRGGSMPVSLQ